MLGDELLGHRLAGITVLHADHQAGKVVDAVYLRKPRRIDHQRLPGHRIRRAEIGHLFAPGVMVAPEATQS